MEDHIRKREKHFQPINWATNIALIQMTQDSDPLSNVLGLSLVTRKIVVGIGDSTKSGQQDFPTDISY